MNRSSSLTGVDRRTSSVSNGSITFQFPDFSQDTSQLHDESAILDTNPGPLPVLTNLHSNERWQPRRGSGQNGSAWINGGAKMGTRQGRQKSLSEAIRTVRTRKGSVSQNAHEIADALKAPVSGKLVILCGVWFATSILSNTSSKAILTAFPRPVTLTVVQFLFVSSWCIFAARLARYNSSIRNTFPVLKNGIRRPNREIIVATLPLTAFQIGGHILNSDAMSRIPVSLVHTIKGLSPLFTVMAYRIFFNVKYSTPTYLSLVPLTLGVIMACSASLGGEFVGLLYAFGSAILFVTQNIVSKQIFNDAAQAEADGLPQRNRKPDKLNLLCYSSGLALLFTLPIWLWSEGFSIFADFLQDASVDLSQRPGSLDHGRLALEFIFNGTFHFTQSLVAFVLLGLVSPVTYSVASLIKRVFVILFAIIWFGNSMTRIQAFGIGLTIAGLYLYDRTSDAAKADKKMRAQQEGKHLLLPLATGDAKRFDASAFTHSPVTSSPLRQSFSGASGYANGDANGTGPGRSRRHSGASPGGGSGWLPPGTKQEHTWTRDDIAQSHSPVR